ncbi:hypothetical protein [Sphingopyxis panaciterrae]
MRGGRRHPLEGSTRASTALLQYELDTPLDGEAHWSGARHADLASLAPRGRCATRAQRTAGARYGRGDAKLVYLDGNVIDAAGLSAEAGAKRRAGLEANSFALPGPKPVSAFAVATRC